MPATTPIRGLPYPIPADTIDVPRDLKALAEEADIDGVPVFADAAERDATITSPQIGQVCFLKTENLGQGELTRYRLNPSGGGQWMPLNLSIPQFRALNVQAGGQAMDAQILVISEIGSTFASPMIAFQDVTSLYSASMLVWGPLNRFQFMDGAHGGYVFVQAAGYVTNLERDLPTSYADLQDEVTDSNGQAATEVDIAKLALRLVERLAAVETFNAQLEERIAVLEAGAP